MSAPRPDTEDYRRLFLEEVPMMDMRAPVEFSHGAFPTSVNLPLMTDKEREMVGITYKQSGQAAAIEMGHSLVHGDIKQARVAAWMAFAEAHPDGYLYCFRRGEKKSERKEDKENYHLTERRYGAFERTFRLPETADADKIKAAFDDGVLTVTVPKKAEAKKAEKKIKVGKT